MLLDGSREGGPADPPSRAPVRGGVERGQLTYAVSSSMTQGLRALRVSCVSLVLAAQFRAAPCVGARSEKGERVPLGSGGCGGGHIRFCAGVLAAPSQV